TEAAEEMARPGTIVDVAVEAGSFSTLVTAIQAAGLVDTLSSEGPFTVFAPTDDAFAALPEGLLDTVLADTDLLTSILTYHVVAGNVTAAGVVTLDSADTVQGEAVTITVDDGSVLVNDANVVQTDVDASNGVIHVIDAVLLPPSVVDALAAGDGATDAEEGADIIATAREAGSFTTLLAAIEAAGLTETLMGDGPFTVFAPTDEAFAAVDEATLDGLLADPAALAQVSLYHVVEGAVPAADVVTLESATSVQGSDVEIVVDGDAVTLNGANVAQTDITTSNGIIHVIDAVLLPPSS
ncbi:MAG: fasciclin domain-containing protein, partial [Acidimicrobiia bacterium]|nr:fasciclin domain-containing protein [Acidimicrobiia bacterium]